MNHLTDQQLLRAYAVRRSEAAFAEIVRRYVDLVYSVALRMVRDAHLAEDVTQSVFVTLAGSAPQLTERAVLSGWLHLTARNLAANVVRADVRRRTREQEAAAMNELLTTGFEADWENIAPHLDAALGELNEADRDAVLLRYFERKSATEMADILGISDDAAQKRVSRAVDQLREFFSRRNVTIGVSGLAVLISANAVQAAPVGLAVTISVAVLAGTAVQTSTVIAATKTIAMTTLQKTIIGAALTVTVGTGVYEAHQAAQVREQNQTLQQQQAPLVEQIQQLQEQHKMDSDTISRLNEELVGSEKDNSELLTLRGQVGTLRSQLKDATLAASRTQPTVAPLSAANVGEQNQAMLDFLGSPVSAPSNLDFAYTRQGLINAVQSAARSAGVTLPKVVIDDSEYPFLVGVVFQNKGDYEKLKGELLKLAGYNYSGSVSGDGTAAMNIIPYNAYPADARKTIINRTQLRESMLYEKIKVAQ